MSDINSLPARMCCISYFFHIDGASKPALHYYLGLSDVKEVYKDIEILLQDNADSGFENVTLQDLKFGIHPCIFCTLFCIDRRKITLFKFCLNFTDCTRIRQIPRYPKVYVQDC